MMATPRKTPGPNVTIPRERYDDLVRAERERDNAQLAILQLKRERDRPRRNPQPLLWTRPVA
jgi:hypothetical protein